MPPKIKSKETSESSKPTAAEKKPLFPSGFKYPLSLLNERCQKNGWENPIVDTRKQPNGYSFTVILTRVQKKSNDKETVRLEPHPPHISPTAIEARHWGATYALYRFCNGIQLNRVLPPGPRDYWNELAAEHKSVPDHQKWMYEADPFAARKTVYERQTQAAKRREQSDQSVNVPNSLGQSSPNFSHAPEVRMASDFRDFVQDSIRKAVSMYPEVEDVVPTIAQDEAERILQQLATLGFTTLQASKASKSLLQASPLMNNLLATLTPLQACIEYLMLHLPECDLPARFLPANNSSDPFITSTHSGTEDLQTRWMEDKAIKECGWPRHVVEECMADQRCSNWSLLIKALNKRLIGETTDDLQDPVDYSGNVEKLDPIELEGLGGSINDMSQAIIPSLIAPVQLNIFLCAGNTIPMKGEPPPMYITSVTVPAYVRLHILSKLLLTFRADTLIESGETVVMAMVRVLEEEWANIEDHGPPEMSFVLRHLLPRKLIQIAANPHDSNVVITTSSTAVRRKTSTHKKDSRSDAQIKEEFENMRRRDRFSSILSGRQKLPAFASKAMFLATLKENQCVVVVGETGCGKTTQLPQFILDSLIMDNQGSKASIIVTQPRRLSAIGVASRVSAERLEDGSVGYAIRGESKQDHRTKLLFCTTGVVLRRLASGDRLQDVTHVIVDEVHERSVDGDLLLLQLKESMIQHRKLKVILMSATINHEIFVKYFNNAPLLSIPGFTHPVQDIYVENVLPLLTYRPSVSKGGQKVTEEEQQKNRVEYSAMGLNEDCVKALQTIIRSDRIDYELVAAVVKHAISKADKPAGILIFLPGVQEIRQCIEGLRGITNAKILPLHANLSSEEQRLVFAPTSQWKIIAATNVAETSITIDDVVYVIDCGKVKETQYDPENSLTRLVEQWVTRAAAKQRRGRAGRTCPGVCYKLYTRKQEEKMSAFPIPEIKRVSLESVSLTVKIMHKDVKGFLSRALDPPDLAAINHALDVLEELGAISDGDVTPLGQHLSTLPLDLRLGKMLILGTIFQCLGPILTVAACVSSKPLFLSPMDKREEARRARARFATGNSDLLTDAHAYDECLRLRTDGAPQRSILAFCEENFISPSTIRDVTTLRNDLFSALSSLNFVPPFSTPTSPSLNRHSNTVNLVKAIILGGLWPRVARVHLPRSAIKFDKVQAGTVQRENTAKEYKFYDIKSSSSSAPSSSTSAGGGGGGGYKGGGGERVFLHPASVLFEATVWKSPFVAYFQKQMTSKVFLRDATEVPMYGLLLFGGPVSVNHIGGGLTVGRKDTYVKLKAWPRIGVLVNQLRRLLDAQLARCVEEGNSLTMGTEGNPVLEAMLALLTNDGLSG